MCISQYYADMIITQLNGDLAYHCIKKATTDIILGEKVKSMLEGYWTEIAKGNTLSCFDRHDNAPPALFATLTYSRWRQEMESHKALLAICAGKPPVTGGFPS